MTQAPATRRRPSVRVGILSHGTSQFDSRAHRVARSLAAVGDTVTLYTRYQPGLPLEESLDGYRVVRVVTEDHDLRLAIDAAGADVPASLARLAAERPTTHSKAAATPDATATGATRSRSSRGRLERLDGWRRRTMRSWGKRLRRRADAIPLTARFLTFPINPWRRAGWFASQVEPHDVWHGMWAGSLPVLHEVRRRHGGRLVYDARDVFLRARSLADMPRWQRAILSRVEARWARGCDAVVQVSEQYATMMERDLGLRDIAVVRNCPDRWNPPVPRPDRIRETLGLAATTRIVLYQGLLMTHRGIEQTMDAIIGIQDAVLVLMGFADHTGRERDDRFGERARAAPYARRVHVIDPVPPAELLDWSASADVMVMCYQPNSENHAYVTPQKLWEAMAAGVPVVASDLPGFRSIVPEAGCGVLVDPTDPAAIAAGIRSLLDLGPDGLRATGERGRAAAHATYNWESQFEVLDAVYARVLADPPPTTR